jgi:predicted ATP-grasp superfamily ATP-dependent carboligase
MDAGSAGRLVRDHILDTLDARVLARFDLDSLIDYRARRPVMTYDEDHWESYEAPELTLHLVHDTVGVPFLFLEGPEPDRAWELFIRSVRTLIEAFDVRLSVAFHGIPMGVPHTRPVGLTAHGTKPELLSWPKSPFGRVQVPGSATSLLEFRLGEWGHDAIGFAVHVPHYLAEATFPAAAEELLTQLSRATGLLLPTGELRQAASRVRGEIDKQVAAADDAGAMVRMLEQQYDAYARGRERTNLPTAEATPLPSADELAAELERFLADPDRRGDPPGR